MTTERAKEMQENIAKEAVALLTIHGDMDTGAYERSIELVGAAGKVPYAETERCLDLITHEREAVKDAEEPRETEHVLPESELPINASGLQTLDNVWGLFEAVVALNSPSQRMALYRMARTREETQNLLQWIEKTEAEKQEWMPPTSQTQDMAG